MKILAPLFTCLAASASLAAEERRWMSTRPLAAALRIAIFTVVSVAVGTSTSLWIERSAPAPHVAKAGR